MNQEYASDGTATHSRRDRVRKLGFDPDHLTTDEQEELLAIEALLRGAHEEPDPILVQT